jgi:hypothetical protein
MDERPATTTLNVACSWTAPITTVSQSSASISSSQSHTSSSQYRTRSCPNPAEGLASYSCEAGLSQGHPHIARYLMTTCQQLPTPQRETLHHAAQPLSTGWVRTRHWEVDDIAASCISRVATAVCAEGGGASEGRAHSVEVQTELRPATPSPHSTPASLQLERTGS